jgi:hypothetical protein
MPTRYAYLASLAALVAACNAISQASDSDNAAAAHGGAGHTGGSSSSGGAAHHGGSTSVGGSAPGGADNATGDAGDSAGGDADADANLSLTSVVAQIVGRQGDSLQFTITGTRPAAGVNDIDVTLSDSKGMPVEFFDNNWDGVPDSAEGRVVFDAPVVSASFVATATLAHITSNVALLAKAHVALLSGDDQATPALDIAIQQQAKVLLGAACDPKNLKNRCDSGLSCSGVPTQCTAGVAPVMQEVEYLHGANGPLILARGTDPDDDMGTLLVEFLDATGQPISVDINNDMTLVPSFDTAPADLSSLGSFFSVNRSALGFDTQVPKVRVTPQDFTGHMGAPVVAAVSTVLQSGNGVACDARGFTGCIAADVCSPGLPVVMGKCANANTARTTECSADTQLDPAKGATIAVGLIDGVSLWDPPAGCTNPENTSRPEATVALHLPSAVSTLTVTTERPETQIDTVLYVLPGCPNDSSTALDCNDDDQQPGGGYASRLVLSNVAAGDYTIVIESGQMGGGAFGLSVSTQ